MVTTERTNNHMNLEQVCSLNIEQSRLLQNLTRPISRDHIGPPSLDLVTHYVEFVAIAILTSKAYSLVLLEAKTDE